MFYLYFSWKYAQKSLLKWRDLIMKMVVQSLIFEIRIFLKFILHNFFNYISKWISINDKLVLMFFILIPLKLFNRLFHIFKFIIIQYLVWINRKSNNFFVPKKIFFLHLLSFMLIMISHLLFNKRPQNFSIPTHNCIWLQFIYLIFCGIY